MTWDPISDPCDYITLGGVKSPGLADVSGAGSVREWDKRKGRGLSGAFSVFTGTALAEFAVKLRLYTPEDWAAWHDFRAIVDKLPTQRGGKGKDTGVLDIWHPLLEDVGITAVAVAARKQAEQTGDGEWTIEINFLEFRFPEVTLAAPEAAADTPTAPATPDPMEIIIKGLTDQVAQLASE